MKTSNPLPAKKKIVKQFIRTSEYCQIIVEKKNKVCKRTFDFETVESRKATTGEPFSLTDHNIMKQRSNNTVYKYYIYIFLYIPLRVSIKNLGSLMSYFLCHTISQQKIFATKRNNTGHCSWIASIYTFIIPRNCIALAYNIVWTGKKIDRSTCWTSTPHHSMERATVHRGNRSTKQVEGRLWNKRTLALNTRTSKLKKISPVVSHNLNVLHKSKAKIYVTNHLFLSLCY